MKKLNLGVPAWFSFSKWEEIPDWSCEQIGYDRIKGKWGIAIRTMSGDYREPDHDSVEAWLFNDAPRRYRIEAATKIPELLDALAESAQEMTQRITETSDQVKGLTSAIIEASKPSNPPKYK